MGGREKLLKTENYFREFLILNPEVSYMWADHHQLLVTANQYNTSVQVLTINQNGDGFLLDPGDHQAQPCPCPLFPPSPNQA